MSVKTPRYIKTGMCCLLAAAMMALAGCGSHKQDSGSQVSGSNGIPANGTPAQIKQAIRQNAMQESAAAGSTPAPGGQSAPVTTGANHP